VGSLLAALGLVFLAELGDKTQLVALGLGARHRLAPVLVGMALAYAAANLVSVAIGGLLGATLPTRAIGIVGGLLFLGFAVWTLRGDDEPEPAAPDGTTVDASDEPGSLSGEPSGEPSGEAPSEGSVGAAGRGDGLRIVASAGVAVFVAEMGDKTMLATATLASQGNPVLVWVGATIGIILSGAVGVLVGRFLGARLPERATRIGAAVLFAGFGIGLLVVNIPA
jgi:Ca2+/H+ antiporter, TMEM165/GDT1 family